MTLVPTDRQLELARFVFEYNERHARPPSLVEISNYLICSVRSACDVAFAARCKGLIAGVPGKVRTLTITHFGLMSIGEPVCHIHRTVKSLDAYRLPEGVNLER